MEPFINKYIIQMAEFIYTPNPNSENPTILVGGKIGQDIIGSQFAKELYQLCEMGKKTITIEINSEGGEVFNGYAIHCAILECQNKYNVEIITLNGGIAASIAGCFSQSGNTRIMYDYSRLMLHNPFTSDGSEDEGLDSIRTSLITLISKRSGLSESKVEELMARTSWIKAEEALDLGLCDEIKSSSKIDPKLKAEILNKIELKSVQFMNTIKIENKNKKLNMNKDLIKILNDAGKTDITENSTEVEILNAISSLTEIKNEVKNDMDDDMDDKMKNHFPGEPKMPGVVSDDMTKKYDDLKKAYDKIMEDNMNMMKIIKAKEEKEYADKVEKVISDGIRMGKIQNSAIETCKLMANADLNLFEKWLDVAPVSKKGLTVEVRDFNNEAEKKKNEAEINDKIKSETDNKYGNYHPSFLQLKTNELMNSLNDKYDPKGKK